MSRPKRALIFALSTAGLLAGPAAVRATESPAPGIATTLPAVMEIEAVCKEGRAIDEERSLILQAGLPQG